MENHNQERHSPRIADKLYSLPDNTMQLLKICTVDTPVADLSLDAVLLEGDGSPKDSCDRKAESLLKC